MLIKQYMFIIFMTGYKNKKSELQDLIIKSIKTGIEVLIENSNSFLEYSTNLLHLINPKMALNE